MQFIKPTLFQFLEELAANNERAWFQANKERYEQLVRDPVLALIEAMRPGMRAISPNLVVDARPIGGSLMRVHRDTRFSKDKRPYKTNVGVHFGIGTVKPGCSPGFYLHLATDECFAGGGLYHPAPPALSRIREAIVEREKDWEKVLASGIELHGEALKRAPAGFDPQHRHVESLKQKSFTTAEVLTRKCVCSPHFLEDLLGRFRRMTPLMEFLSASLDFVW